MVSSGQTYFLTNKKSQTVCDLSGDDQTSVIGFTAQGSDNQKWKVQDTGNGWTLQNIFNKKYLDFDKSQGTSPGNGTKVVAVETNSPCTWDIRPDQNDSNAYRIFVRGSNFNVDLSDHGNPNPNTPVTLWEKWEGENQVWSFKEA
ncbi:carbohydrate-binding module family 13 protein [Thelephora terrestris]|uniref:Carbohydrate-binding module family 13 protein n=1 Tax=Thelephora terrestris TaxID=56493 RepID=A0A9P6L207_9AGAM|nr:carbohydrate-binding module family 13 protein [Thelephora terrestris]